MELAPEAVFRKLMDQSMTRPEDQSERGLQPALGGPAHKSLPTSCNLRNQGCKALIHTLTVQESIYDKSLSLVARTWVLGINVSRLNMGRN